MKPCNQTVKHLVHGRTAFTRYMAEIQDSSDKNILAFKKALVRLKTHGEVSGDGLTTQGPYGLWHECLYRTTALNI